MARRNPNVTPASDPSPTERPKGPGGAPKGNINAGTHLATRRVKARDQRDRHARQAEREAHEILVAAGLEDHPLAKLVARQVRRLETMAARYEAHFDQRGTFDRKGDAKPAARAFVDVVDRLLGEARRLLDQLALLTPKPTGPVEYRILSVDGEPFAFGFGDGAQRPMPADPLAAGTSAFDGSTALPGPAGGAQALPGKVSPATLLDAHPSDVRHPTAEPLPPREPVTIESPLARNWRLGRSPWGDDD